MDKRDILKSLSDMFEEKPDDLDYTFERKNIDNNSYLTLIAKDMEADLIRDPDFEAFVNIMKYYNTQDLNYAALKLQNNKVKILKELPDAEREKIMSEIRDFHSKLLGANSQNLSFIEVLIKDWINTIL